VSIRPSRATGAAPVPTGRAVVPGQGLEPRFRGPEPRVLPLDDPGSLLLLLVPRRGLEPRFPDPKASVLPLDERGSSRLARPESDRHRALMRRPRDPLATGHNGARRGSRTRLGQLGRLAPLPLGQARELERETGSDPAYLGWEPGAHPSGPLPRGAAGHRHGGRSVDRIPRGRGVDPIGGTAGSRTRPTPLWAFSRARLGRAGWRCPWPPARRAAACASRRGFSPTSASARLDPVLLCRRQESNPPQRIKSPLRNRYATAAKSTSPPRFISCIVHLLGGRGGNRTLLNGLRARC
jgi:hypothetical protein